MAVPLPLLAALAGGIGGWLVTRVVDYTTRHLPHRRRHLETVISIAASVLILGALGLRSKEPDTRLFVYGGLVLALVGVTVFDIRTQIIPHLVTIPGTIAGLIAGSFVLPSGFRESMLGLLLGGGVLLLATVFEAIRKKEIGGGDWKYAAMIGSFIGPQRIVVALVLTGVFGAVGAIALALSGGQARPHALGPWLSVGAVASILLG